MEFKEGEIYVDINTNNVYIYNESISKGEVLNQRVLCLGSNLDNNVGIITIGEDFRRIKDALRLWQQSDEPTHYDENRWGKIGIGLVYYVQKNHFSIPVAMNKNYVFRLENHYGSNRPDKWGMYYDLDFSEYKLNIITRPAFSHEIQGLTRPKLEGYIDNDATME